MFPTPIQELVLYILILVTSISLKFCVYTFIFVQFGAFFLVLLSTLSLILCYLSLVF